MQFNPDIVISILNSFNNDLRQHSYNVCYLSVLIAEHVGYSQNQIATLAIGALLHDIGKSCIDEALLNKPGSLTKKEFAIIKSHTVLGAKMIENFEESKVYLPIILYHHERWDGGGYEGLAQHKIPELARIVTIADAFDAMTSYRPYQQPKTLMQALKELNKNKGTQFAPYLVEAFESCILKSIKNPCNFKKLYKYLNDQIINQKCKLKEVTS